MPTEADLIRSIDDDALSDWIVGQRWFASKARDVTIGLVEVLVLDEDPPLGLALVEARFAAGTHDLYQLLVGPGDLEAMTTPAPARALARLLTGEARVQGEHGVIAFHWSGEPLAAEHVRLMGAEQSNTSIVIDESAVLKVFRRLEAGDNPELEMVRFLTSRGSRTSRPCGAGTRSRASSSTRRSASPRSSCTTAATAGTWCSRPSRRTRSARSTTSASSARSSGGCTPSWDRTSPTRTSRRTTRARRASRSSPRRSTRRSNASSSTCPPTTRRSPRSPAAARRSEIACSSCRTSSSAGKLIRHHGDLHLGQTLRTPDRWVVLDFEGEPARSLIERRRKRSPLRDVAGMLRSFAYAATAASLLKDATVPEDWEATARERFLNGYFTEVDAGLLPASEAGIRQLLAIFELEKAVYELRYELNNRPDWVPIPVAGIARLLQEPLT